MPVLSLKYKDSKFKNNNYCEESSQLEDKIRYNINGIIIFMINNCELEKLIQFLKVTGLSKTYKWSCKNWGIDSFAKRVKIKETVFHSLKLFWCL